MTGLEDGRVIITLTRIDGPSIEMNYKWYEISSGRGHNLNRHVKTATFCSDQPTKYCQLRFRQAILDSPEKHIPGGTLTLSLYMKQTGVQNMPSPPFVPSNPMSQAILKMFADEKSADILFEVSDSENENAPTRVYAHRLILQACASTLADFCEGYADLTPVPICGIKPEIFKALLRHVYGGGISSKLLKERSKDFICAADLYGISNLKVEAEAAYAKSTTITIENVVTNFYFADTKKCALLKEKVMEFLVENGQEVLNKLSFKDAPESATMFQDFMTAVAMGKSDDKDYDGDDPIKFKTMSVNALRRKLSDKGLDIDGTREMMIAALEGSYAKTRKKRKRDENDTVSDLI
eukprot:CAMPEP_0172301364 /NCGR_PEP_ID=MMETSP1058-20130122/3270_1 /TAXON_ID=83371 /ORGANISM="Detonula confervacea, Strain CCMP 353" /LENGTH=350 /DNA_ID=CAMNT_0013011447 /DNA_START=350 /DNA_END=1402 /DNA_ORIENTATION=+